MLKMLQKKASFLVLFAGRVSTVISSSASFAGIRFTRDVVILVVN